MYSKCYIYIYASVFTETSILDIKSRCLSLQCGTDSKLVDTDCRLHLPVICSDRKISMYISSSYNTSIYRFILQLYLTENNVIALLKLFYRPRVQLLCILITSTSKLIDAVAKQT